ncbi:hypothetical protein EZV62_019496 [Acer yangbiense]|uniref:Uncharacterized protein n=1 Tax=Acer yangbiense TaxID=1000413 RepID=A0A5C7HB20_9ROSI|nr:hypothetical protein EZV62_019496 [Acer yangbiense]
MAVNMRSVALSAAIATMFFNTMTNWTSIHKLFMETKELLESRATKKADGGNVDGVVSDDEVEGVEKVDVIKADGVNIIVIVDDARSDGNGGEAKGEEEDGVIEGEVIIDDIGSHGIDHLEEINNLKKQFSNEFEMKDLSAAKQILGMRISKDEKRGILQLSQVEFWCRDKLDGGVIGAESDKEADEGNVDDVVFDNEAEGVEEAGVIEVDGVDVIVIVK